MTAKKGLPLVQILQRWVSKSLWADTVKFPRDGAQTFSVLITQSTLSHIGKFDSTLGACIHEPVTAHGVEFGSCDYFGQFLHVCGLDINNVEALILNIEVPKIDSQIIAADKGFSVTID
ncbi:unnamed protein product [Fusarium graminearum]|nr:unnamed protein product [Fusarium graminearum]